MGSSGSKQAFLGAVSQLVNKTTPIDAADNELWEQLLWSDAVASSSDLFTLIEASSIRTMRENCPSNLATICFKAVEHLVAVSTSGFGSPKEHKAVLNCVRLLTRLLPYVFEDVNWRNFFWSTVPDKGAEPTSDELAGTASGGAPPLAHSLLSAISDLLFCPEFTVLPSKKPGPDNPEELASLDSCEYIWESGVGCSTSPGSNSKLDSNRSELLKLLLTCFSEAIYLPPSETASPNRWVAYFTSEENRHALPLFTSLLNTVLSYDPVGYGVPYYHTLVSDAREPLVETAAQVLMVTLDSDSNHVQAGSGAEADSRMQENLFCSYMGRIHREEDFHFILHGFTTLLNNPLVQTYLPNSCKKIHFHQELLILFWKMCDINKKFLYHVLKSSRVLELLVPILHHLNEARADPARTGLMHIGIFILLLLSGERNFGVRLNKPYQLKVPIDVPVFHGTHADLLVLVFHKVITAGHQRLQPLYECLMTILVNVSPYLKSLSQVASSKLLHLTEAFSTPWFLFAAPTNHHLVFFLLEIFNNIIQYQFDGNCQLVYSIIRKRSVFHELANVPVDPQAITKSKRVQLEERKSPTQTLSGPSEGEPAASSDAAVPSITLTAVGPQSAPPDGASPAPDPNEGTWHASKEWVQGWKAKLPLQTILRLLQVLVPQVEKICIDKGLTDEGEILKFLQHGTLVGLLPVPHPILIRKYQPNAGTTLWFRTYMWGVVYLRNADPPIWYDTGIKLFEIQKA